MTFSPLKTQLWATYEGEEDGEWCQRIFHALPGQAESRQPLPDLYTGPFLLQGTCHILDDSP